MTKKGFIKRLKSDKQECLESRRLAIIHEDNYLATRFEAMANYIDCLLYWLEDVKNH